MLKPAKGRRSPISLLVAAVALLCGTCLVAQTMRGAAPMPGASPIVDKLMAGSLSADTLDLFRRVVAPLVG